MISCRSSKKKEPNSARKTGANLRAHKKVKVGAHDYVIRWVAPENLPEDRHGDCDDNKCIIRVSKDLIPSRAWEILMHEIEHALWHFFDLEDGASEEKCVTVMARGRLMIERDNPWLRDYERRGGGKADRP